MGRAKLYDLKDYLEARQNDGFGWEYRLQEEYAESLPEGYAKWECIAGRYSQLLSEVVDLVGDGRLLALLEADRELDRHMRSKQKAAYDFEIIRGKS